MAIARRGIESHTKLDRHRWKVERSLAWLPANRRLTVRHERRAGLLTVFLQLACALICTRQRTEVAGLYERAAAELEVPARHARVAHDICERVRFLAVGARAWAAHGHDLTAQELLSQAARLHADRARPE